MSKSYQQSYKKIGKGIRWVIQEIFFKKLFSFWQFLGFHVTRNYFYEPIPDTRTLKDNIWQKLSELSGLNINDRGQINLLSLFASKFKKEYESLPKNKTSVPYQYYVNNKTFGPVDGEILYCLIRHFKPKRIFEIGSGYSTYLSAQAILKNDNGGKLTAFEPYPVATLKSGFPGLSQLITRRAQEIPLSDFRKLKKNDILFIDSSHVLKIGSDVQYEYLEILPRLNKGVLIHVHDIFLPAEYPKKWIKKEHRFWTEQYLLQAFLAFNGSFEILWAGSYMHLKHPDQLTKAFGSYKKKETWPASFWLRKTK
ncbi:MAG: class I SAM-dependent methyltransferase [Candidatus Kerfeldbacteria bacterium CG_4_10_14_0_8_um_filter_42_10]|uniref:Class I SAM-dependent methyltransferase n=1 Tax=Candidatus Kerfeldbacteria bacterium CG_4_10_14_0_8_um_filter_42_10 TaxID=2014248 RepID=A0A2M7RGU2_9BACT|nr:MAG: class I SAM-dependent methyltransferase [Candidatus Kerfeldbacteria bacterium CG_4_10_14_0_8_um_filter_42_10]